MSRFCVILWWDHDHLRIRSIALAIIQYAPTENDNYDHLACRTTAPGIGRQNNLGDFRDDIGGCKRDTFQ